MRANYHVYIICAIFSVASLGLSNALAQSKCVVLAETCIEGKDEIRNIDNVDVNPGCWRSRVTYKCEEKGEKIDDNCQQLRNQGCLQIGAKCKHMVNGTCVIQDNVYNCPVKKCEGIKEVSCARNVFCVSGNCTSSNPTKAGEQDSGKTMAYLSVLTEAAKEILEDNKNNPIDLNVKSAQKVIEQNEHKPIIFAGTKIECSRNILPGITKDCCADNEGIFSCADDEKKLIEAKRAGRTIEVGKYCHNKVPLTGICTSYHTAYCVFGSKLARIIQNNGRKNQLGIGFGYVNDDDKGSNVNCRAITPYELSKMDFSKMNFGELYDAIKKEVEKRLPTSESLKQKISGHTYQDLKEKTPEWKAASSKAPMEPNARDRITEFYGK